MKRFLPLIAVMVVLAGCGGGSSSSYLDNSIRVTGQIYPGGIPVHNVVIEVFRQGHVGESDHMVCSVDPSNYVFRMTIRDAGTYDIEVHYRYYTSDMVPGDGQGVHTLRDIRIAGPITDLGEIDLGLGVP